MNEKIDVIKDVIERIADTNINFEKSKTGEVKLDIHIPPKKNELCHIIEE